MVQGKSFMVCEVVQEDFDLKNWSFVWNFCFRTFYFCVNYFFLWKKRFCEKKIQKIYKVVDFFMQKWIFSKGSKSFSRRAIETRQMSMNYKSYLLIKTPFKNLIHNVTGWRKPHFDTTGKKKKSIQNTRHKKNTKFSLRNKYHMINILTTRKLKIVRKIVKQK